MKIPMIITPRRMNWTLPESRMLAAIISVPLYAGPSHCGRVPPVSTALRLRSARSRNGTVTASPKIEVSKNAHEYTGTSPESWYRATVMVAPAYYV